MSKRVGVGNIETLVSGNRIYNTIVLVRRFSPIFPYHHVLGGWCRSFFRPLTYVDRASTIELLLVCMFPSRHGWMMLAALFPFSGNQFPFSFLFISTASSHMSRLEGKEKAAHTKIERERENTWEQKLEW